ncbi:hypothetical protein A3H16_02375 [Candidatus Kaiserbacteria bacterium RIFCSPLOWO2_12_FULL_53_8]|uniref:Uncharacterized protein n=2 Tax=Candidatus Kaiseribacteriota TaxID=1752734 RepID=A0A1F6CV39_9BACT|nr:MAG: hypothetical protein A2851_05740 [Candidatus Kaiserbacteria bacterium RIFCSPHIGHO2_01_FULL_53_29]OGG91844.1 MAG: hypothetical protein A3H16_02375 [Candidatus Kaiserbacteria bacterium RIFCSPLOWO2_12_FULL_53_8]
MSKYIVGVIVVIVVAAAAVFVWKTLPGTASPSTPTPSSPTAVATSTYATSTFSVVYPADYTVDDQYTYTQVNPKKPISGVKFTIPLTIATGTDLSSDSYVSVEWLPRAKNCTGDIYLADNVKPQTLTEGGVEYSVATSSGAGAGNRYEEQVYALAGSSPCTALRYFIHYAAIENFPAGAVQEFDRAALISDFDKIRQSLVLTR